MNISPESKKSEEDKPIMETVMETVEKEEYAVQEFVPETIVVTETPSNENHEEEIQQMEEQEKIEVHDHPNAIEVEDDHDEVQEQSEDVGVTEITIRYQEIVDENSRANVGFDEEKVEEKQAIVEVREEEERGSHDVELVEPQAEFKQEMEQEKGPEREDEQEKHQEQEVIIEEKMEVELQSEPEPEPEMQREEEVVQQSQEKASTHNTEVLAESPNEPERKTESPVRQEQENNFSEQRQEMAIDLAKEPHEVLPQEPMLADMNILEGILAL